MPLSRYANQRDLNEPEIIKALLKIGASVERQDEPLDLLVGYRGKNWLLEIKDAKDHIHALAKMTTNQTRFFMLWRGQKALVWNVESALKAIGAVK